MASTRTLLLLTVTLSAIILTPVVHSWSYIPCTSENNGKVTMVSGCFIFYCLSGSPISWFGMGAQPLNGQSLCEANFVVNHGDAEMSCYNGGQEYTNGQVISYEGCREACLNSTVIQINPNDQSCQGMKRKRGVAMRLNNKFHRN
ncbi:uncharacterized protein [Clytia hemisphaerica]|uniref:Cnidarian restricted protein n=1 Tax=Clytia hemisphaerica TaxID=252671 RepID=A0A7M5US30_9CNID|eukprot:TCONS_00033038-protein